MFFEELRAKSQFTQENGKNKTNIGLWSGWDNWFNEVWKENQIAFGNKIMTL
jgi:hypothetical protein